MSKLRVALVGAYGRMGRQVLALVKEQTDFVLAAAIERPGRHPDPVADDFELGSPGVTLHTAWPADTTFDLVVDFSAPAQAAHYAPLSAAHGCAYLVASTGLTPADEQALADAAKHVPVLAAANFSLGVTVMRTLVEQAARALGRRFDIEIAELHHRHKQDAPSGTARLLSEAVSKARPQTHLVPPRNGVGAARAPDELGVVSLRGGDVAGEHTVFFLGDGERLEITHRATSPRIFAQGALDAGQWLHSQPPGRYTMQDFVLGR